MSTGAPEYLGSSLHSGRGSDVEAPLPKTEHGLVAALLRLHNTRVDFLQTQGGELRSIKEATVSADPKKPLVVIIPWALPRTQEPQT